MRISAKIGQMGLLLVSGCSFLEPKTTFGIVSADRPVTSATLKLCRQAFPLAPVDGRWEVSIHVPGDCDGGISAVMSGGTSIFCQVGYVTGGDGSTWLFDIKDDACHSHVTYGETVDRNVD
jgi:hypothetical protein